MHRREMAYLLLLLCVVGFTACERVTPGAAPSIALCLSNNDCAASQVCDRGTCVNSSTFSDAGPPDPRKETCTPGTIGDCYSADAITRNVAPCKAGKRTCKADYTWGSCLDEIVPGVEVCDGVDNDCNGKIDDNTDKIGLPCLDNSKQGACRSGVFTECKSGQLVCVSNTVKKEESCDNGIDDDCDGEIDEFPPCTCSPGAKRKCGEERGVCRPGEQVCGNKLSWGPCLGETKGSDEICDGLDNDCDGEIDEGFPNVGQLCVDGTGECRAEGMNKCSTDGKKVVCSAKVGPSRAELCDGLDNDCDGEIDEDYPRKDKTCSAGVGDCKGTGTFTCSVDGVRTFCNAIETASSPEICDGKDNDCDGNIDNVKGTTTPITVACYSGPVGTQGRGICKAGVAQCIKGKPQNCTGEVKPKPNDECTGFDDNCDGTVNGGCSCNEGDIRDCGTNVGACTKGKQKCDNGKWGACGGNNPTTEVCDGIDNDCDGDVDEDFTLNRACDTGVGVCKEIGKTVCRGDGSGVKCSESTIQPKTEVCDGKDNDCDGNIDNGSASGGDCNTGQDGECQKGTIVCVSGASTCAPKHSKRAEICRNGKDDDCDGQVDEVCGPSYAYAIVKSQGGTLAKRDFTSANRTGNGRYQLKSSTSRKCGNTPLFLSPKDLYMRHVTYTCSGDDYNVNISEQIKSWQRRIDLVNGAFYAVQPPSNGDWLRVTCDDNRDDCKVDIKSGNITSFSRRREGEFHVKSSLCNDVNRPIFVSITSSAGAHYSNVRVLGNDTCEVVIRKYSGSGDDRGFSIWFPDKSKALFATVNPTSGGVSILASNNFNDQFARWSSQYVSYPGGTCPNRNSCSRVQISLNVANLNSAALVQTRVLRYATMSFTPDQNKLIVSSLRYDRFSRNDYGILYQELFSLLLVH